ncbi:MAG TPA: CE1759 family FMN reductase [Nocardioidaceae bacterium]|nr:CE1759 family FMN reductase [Nocardioidaceae bacterium]
MTRTVAVLTAGLSQPSSTRLLADQLAAAADRALRLHGERVQVEVVELRDLAHALTDNLLTGFPSGGLAEAVETVRRADALIAVTPIFTASYSGLFKTFFDVLEDGMLEGKPVLIAATAGTARHSLALEYAVRPLFAHLRARVVPTAVFAASEDFAGSAPDGSLSARVGRAARELADALQSDGRLGSRTAGAVDHFADPTPFEELLRG